jgi:hypothetical protein
MTHQEAMSLNVADLWKDVAINDTIDATLPGRLAGIRQLTLEQLVGMDAMISDTMIEVVVVTSVDRVETPVETREAHETLGETVVTREDVHVSDPPVVTHANPHGNQVRDDCRAPHQGLHGHQRTCPIGT